MSREKVLLLLCCSKDQQSKQAVAEEKPEQIEENPEVLKAKLKEEYEKKFEVPISDFELSISRMYFQYNKPSSFDIEAIRTAKGVHIITVVR